jgi:DNA-binding MarR family transcriptional regulator
MMALLGEIFLHGKDSHDFYQLTGAQKKILLFLAMNGKQRMGDVAHMISSSMPAASAVVDRLEQLGLVERKRDGLDRRVVMVELTERGGRVHMEMVRVRESRMAYLLNSLPEESRSQYINCLIQMNSLFKEAAVKAEEKSTPKAPPVAASSDL